MERKKSKAIRLTKKEKAEIERDNEKSKLLDHYIEGVSNVDYEKIPEEVIYANPFIKTADELQKALGKTVPLISKEEWVKLEMAKLDELRPKEPPSYKLQDPVDQTMKYRQKFMQQVQKIKPEILEDLRQFADNFVNVF